MEPLEANCGRCGRRIFVRLEECAKATTIECRSCFECRVAATPHGSLLPIAVGFEKINLHGAPQRVTLSQKKFPSLERP